MKDGLYGIDPPHEPIDWSKENEFMFLRGILKVETMSRDEFERRYPALSQPVANQNPS